MKNHCQITVPVCKSVILIHVFFKHFKSYSDICILNRKENFHIVKTKECMSYLKKVTTDAHNVFNNTLGQKHLFIY